MSLRARAAASFANLPPSIRLPLLHRLGRYAPWEVGFDFRPPAAGPGETIGPPDFVGIGVQKAGTTWWNDLINTHPAVYSRPDLHKERHFFDRFGAAPFRPSDADDYHGWFPRPTGSITGEWTPDYFSSPWVPPLLQRSAPDARLLLLLRDPVDRYLSGVAHHRRTEGAVGPFVTADAIQRGFYHRALGDWTGHVPPSRLLVLQFERCVVDTAGQLRATFEFLGLPDHPPPPSVVGTETPVPTRSGPDDDLRRRLVSIYESDVLALAARHPGIDLALWPNFAYLAGGAAPGGEANSPTRRP